MDTPETSRETPVIEMQDVRVGSLLDPEATVLEDVNWKVGAGDYWAVAGMHASGKSAIMHLAAGLMAPLAGSYKFFGHEMPIFEDEHLAKRLRLGLVFDGGKLFQHLSVADNIALPLRYHTEFSAEEIAGRVAAMLELTELTPWAGRSPGSLGHNWQKRAGLARALILEPELLLLDNPLGGLDLRHSQWWLNFLGQLSKGHDFLKGRRMTLAATVEDLRPWRERADHFALLQGKRLTVLGQRSGLSGHTERLVKELLAEEYLGS